MKRKLINSMKQIRLNSRFLMWSFVLVGLNLNVSAQENLETITQEKDSSVPVKNKTSHSLYTNIGFGNNMVYMGSDLSQNKPFYYGALTYGYNDEFYASVSAYHLSAFDQFMTFNTFSLSYNHNLKKGFDISLGISRYQVPTELTDTLFNNFFYANAAIGLDWKILYTNLSVGGILSETSSAYFQLRNSRYIQTPEFFDGKAYFAFDPYMNLLFGSLTKTVTADGTKLGISPPFKSGNSSGSKSPGGGSSGTTSTIFTLMEVDFGLPVSFNIGKLTIEIEPGYALPLYSESDVFNPKGFVLLLGCYFKIL
jgi:hypothetical protein